LEGEEHTFAGALFRREFQQVFSLEDDRTLRHFVRAATGQHLGERALARAVGAHDGVDLAGLNREVDALENFLAGDDGVQITDFKHGSGHGFQLVRHFREVPLIGSHFR